MLKHKIIFLNLLLSCLFSLQACSHLKAAPAESSPFLTNASLLKPAPERSPWDAVWSSSPGQIAIQSKDVRTLYIAPVNIDYLNYKKDKSGKEVKVENLSDEDIKAMTDLIQKSFTEAVQNKKADNLTIVSNPDDAQLKLELALVELMPTIIAENVAADLGGFIVPGSKVIEKAAEAGAQAAGGSFAAGSIAIEMKISDSKSGELLAEAKDRESDPASIIFNVKDFEEYGWSRKTVKDWSEQFAEIFSTPATTKISGESHVSFIPW